LTFARRRRFLFGRMKTPGMRKLDGRSADGSAHASGAGQSTAVREDGFTMLGVIHRDPSGPHLLDRWLTFIQPHVITLEFSNYGKAFREKMGPRYRERIEEVYNRLKRDNLPCYDNALSMVLSYVEMPYEFVRTSRYGQAHGVPVYLIDMDFFSYLNLRETEKLLDPVNLEKLLSDDGTKKAGCENILARLYFEEGVRTVTYTDEMCMRDKYMSNKIKVLRKRYMGQRLLHVSGWQHLHDPRNLYGPLNPLKVFLYDKTICI
jgi:hypothetical protein